MKILSIVILLTLLSGCASYKYPSQAKVGEALPTFSGESLAGEPFVIPDDLKGKNTLLLFGYIHDAQFDIDRWLIGLDMTNTQVDIYEIPAIQSAIVGIFSTFIDGGMREGIPKELWRDVITVYDDGDMVQKYTGNIAPKNARIILLDKEGIVVHFYDRGFSVAALNELRDVLQNIP